MDVQVGVGTGYSTNKTKRIVPCMTLIALELVLPNQELVLIVNE